MSSEVLLIDVAAKGTAILGAAWVVATALRRRSAAARHLVWAGTFAALLALPLLSVLLPALPVRAADPLGVSGVVFRSAVSTARDTSPAAQLPRGITVPPGTARLDWHLGLVLLWGAGAAVSFAQMLGGWIATTRMRGPEQAFAGADIEPLLQALGMRRAVSLRQARNGTMPMAVGLFRPAIVLPAEAAAWSAERRRVVLLHELAHVRRGDLPVHVMARTALSLYWFNPLGWVAWRELLKERERAADDLVLNAGARASDYASHLLEIARTMQSSRLLAPAALAMARRSQLEGRLRAILDSHANRTAPRRLSVAIASLLALVVIVPFAALQAQEDRTASMPADVDATIRVATSQRNYDMLERGAKAAEVLQQYGLARRLLDASVAIRAEVSGPQSVAYGAGLIKIGDLERSRNNLREAQNFYTKAVSVLGNRPEAAPALVNLGIFSSPRMQDPELAISYFQRAQAADPAHAGMPVMWMAIIQDQQKNPGQAETLFEQALSLEEAGSAEAALTMELYSAFLDRQHRAEEARSFRDQAVSMRIELGKQSAGVGRGSQVSSYRVGAGVTPPRLTFKVEPAYAEEARLAKYQGTVVVATVIGTDGLAQNMRVIRGLGLGLDEQALKAIAQWKFQPGARGGQPVPVQATVEVNFRLL
jgi:TonB family protein